MMAPRMMKLLLSGWFCLIVAGLSAGAAEPGAGVPEQAASAMDPDGLFPRDAGITLPNGKPAPQWEVPAKPSRTYYVDQNHPQASDAGEGTADRPFRTINRAAQAVQAGQRVLVKPGIYREHVQPLHGGTGHDNMVTFEGEPGHEVIIRGSCVLPKTWQRSIKSQPAAPASAWTLRLPESEFAQDNPFSRSNIDERDRNGIYMQFPKQAPYTYKRGLLFQDGKRLKQVARYEDLAAAAGTYWVDEGGWVLYARLLGDTDPNASLMEATNRSQCFAPRRPGCPMCA